MTTDQILTGIGLVITLAVAAQLLAARFGVPAIVLLLPAGFIAGNLTSDVDPNQLLGDLYQPFVAVAVGVILFEAGSQLSVREIDPSIRRAVGTLVSVGVVVTGGAIAITVALLFSGMATGVALVIGAILVVSGPTVVVPLLGFVRPARRIRTLLKWEGVLVDPIGAILGVLVFEGVQAGLAGDKAFHAGELLESFLVGLAVGLAGAVILVLLLAYVDRNIPRMGVAVMLTSIIAVVVLADVIHDDYGLLAATIMGAAFGNQRRVPVAHALFEFNETLVQMLIGVLFVLVSASVSQAEVRRVLPEAVALLVVMVLVIRPVAVVLSTAGAGFGTRERAFAAWMAPRGIIAGATASSFGPALAQSGAAGANDVLPLVFCAIFGTVVLYGLTAAPVARWLGVAGKGGSRVLIVGGHGWARDMAAALTQAGVAVSMWVGPQDDLVAALDAGIEAGRSTLMVDAPGREAALEDVSDVLLLSANDDFNTVAAAELRDELGSGHVFRLATDHGQAGFEPPTGGATVIGHGELTFAEIERRVAAGAAISSAAGGIPLLMVTDEGRLSPVGADVRGTAINLV